MVRNRRLMYSRVPVGYPVPGQDITVESDEFDIDQEPPPEGLVTKNLYASFDPYLRCRMSKIDFPFPLRRFIVGQTIWNFSISKVLSSRNDLVKKGYIIFGQCPIEEYSVLESEKLEGTFILPNTHQSDLKFCFGVAGIPGLTAYTSLRPHIEAFMGQSIFMSSAAGAVGQIVGQLAKHKRLHVIGSVGSDDKLNYITNELGYDGGFNYKSENPTDALRRLAPNGIDIYYDNVGGEQLDAALEAMRPHGTIIACGMISDYNKDQSESYGLKNWAHIYVKSITVKGFWVNDKYKTVESCRSTVVYLLDCWLNGWLKYKMSITEGIENGPEGFVGMLKRYCFVEAFVLCYFKSARTNVDVSFFFPYYLASCWLIQPKDYATCQRPYGPGD